MKPGPRRSPLRSQAGFTLIEVAVALAVGGLITWAVGGYVWNAGEAQSAVWRETERATRQDAALGALRRAVRGAARTLAPTATLGPVRIRPGTEPDGTPSDTLEVVLGDGPAVPVASRPCRAASAPCTVLLGDHAARFAPGDLVLVGEPALTGRLVRLAAADATRVFAAPCGADCAERLACSFGTRAVPPTQRVVGSVRRPGGATAPGPCPQSYFPDGSSCEEVWAAATPAPRLEPVCTASGPSARFTELLQAGAAPVPSPVPGNPGPASGRSAGAGGFRLRAQRVRVVRFWVRGAGTEAGDLVREEDRDRDGAWDEAEVIAPRVHGLLLHTRAPWTPGWVRGLPYVESDLADDDANPRLTAARAATPLPGSAPLGRALARVPSDLRQLRVRMILPRPEDPARPPAAPSRDTATAVLPLIELTQGGAGETP
ncbi:MAG: prepilin-type N-terminal cleavage/methylation domain-containing protein [Gemmatimonadota bacterium]